MFEKDILKYTPSLDWGVIYLHVFPNGKVYIGKTTEQLGHRFGDAGSGYNSQPKMTKAIREFGARNIETKILGEYPIDKLDKLEYAAIIEYDSINNGYNDYDACNYTKKVISRGKRTIEDNCPRVYGKDTVLYTNPVKNPDHLTIVDTFIYENILLKDDRLYITETSPDDTNDHFGVKVKYRGKNTTLAKYIVSKLLNIQLEDVKKVTHISDNRRDNRLSNLKYDGKPILEYLKNIPIGLFKSLYKPVN